MRKIVLLLALGCAMTACSPDDPAPTVTPTPSASSTPAANPSTDPLYLEAVDVYKKFFAEVDKAEMSGFKPASLSPAIDPYVTGDLLEVVESSYQSDRAAGITPRGTGTVITRMAPNPGITRGASIVSLRVCSDGSAVEVIDNASGKSIGRGRKTYKEVFFKRIDGKIKGFAQDSEVVSTCPF